MGSPTAGRNKTSRSAAATRKRPVLLASSTFASCHLPLFLIVTRELRRKLRLRSDHGSRPGFDPFPGAVLPGIAVALHLFADAEIVRIALTTIGQMQPVRSHLIVR